MYSRLTGLLVSLLCTGAVAFVFLSLRTVTNAFGLASPSCDYSNKRQPMAFNEVKECCKGHARLGEKLSGEHVNTIGKRHATRLMCDAYGKGIVRGQVENTNLRANAKSNDVDDFIS